MAAAQPMRGGCIHPAGVFTVSEQPGGIRDRMRLALAKCTFLPGSSHKRFARQVAAIDCQTVTVRQWRHVIRLAWRYRRQMPFDLVPSRDAVEALDSGWQEQSVAGVSVMVAGPKSGKRERAPRRPPTPLPLFGDL